MKTYFLIALLSIGFTVQAQHNDREEQIASLRVAFLTKKLDLSPTEAQQFWPVYNAYSDQISDLQKEERKMHRELRKGFDTVSEEDATQALDRHVAIQNTKTASRAKLVNDLKAVLPAKKILILLKAEEDFKRSIIERLRGRRNNKRQ